MASTNASGPDRTASGYLHTAIRLAGCVDFLISLEQACLLSTLLKLITLLKSIPGYWTNNAIRWGGIVPLEIFHRCTR